MNCREAQALINKYVHNELDLKSLEEFLLHVELCPDCMEELEVYYIVFQGFRRLDEDENIAVNYHDEFIHTLTANEDKIRHVRNVHIFRRVAFLLLMFIIMIGSNFSMNLENAKDNLINRSEGESEFHLPIYFFEERMSLIDDYLEQYYGIDFSALSNTTIDLATMHKKQPNIYTGEAGDIEQQGSLQEKNE